MELEEVFDKSNEICVYEDGNKTEYYAGSIEYEKIVSQWNDLLKGAHLMPAFGVSLDPETRKEMQNGLWLEFIFDKVIYCGGMPFERLLVDVVSEYSGFNIVRYNCDTGYDGRCYYFDLVNKNMSSIYDILSII